MAKNHPSDLPHIDEAMLEQFNGYYGKKRTAEIVHHLYDGMCQGCGKRIATLSDMDVGHVVPRSAPGFFQTLFASLDIDNLINLQAMHAGCNRSQGAGFIASPLMAMNALALVARKIGARLGVLAAENAFGWDAIMESSARTQVALPCATEVAPRLWLLPAAPVVRQMNEALNDAGIDHPFAMDYADEVSRVLTTIAISAKLSVGLVSPEPGFMRRMVISKGDDDLRSALGAALSDPDKPLASSLTEPCLAFDRDPGAEFACEVLAPGFWHLAAMKHFHDAASEALDACIGPDKTGRIIIPAEGSERLSWLRSADRADVPSFLQLDRECLDAAPTLHRLRLDDIEAITLSGADPRFAQRAMKVFGDCYVVKEADLRKFMRLLSRLYFKAIVKHAFLSDDMAKRLEERRPASTRLEAAA